MSEAIQTPNDGSHAPSGRVHPLVGRLPRDGQRCMIERLGKLEEATWEDSSRQWVRDYCLFYAPPDTVSRWWSIDYADAFLPPPNATLSHKEGGKEQL